jgi:N-acetylglutamate synthase/N-acetylornithine aminotransferase
MKVDGIRLGTAVAGIKRKDRDDLTLIEIAAGGRSAAVVSRGVGGAAHLVVG